MDQFACELMLTVVHEEGRPARPHVPLVLWVLVAVLATLWMTLTYAPDFEGMLGFIAVVWMAALAALLGAWAYGRARYCRVPAVMLAAISLAWLCAQGELAAQTHASDLLGSNRLADAEFLIESDMRATSYGVRGRASAWIDGVSLGDVWFNASEAIPPQTLVQCRGSFRPTESDEKGAWSRTRGIAGSFQCRQIVASHPQTGVISQIMRIRACVLQGFDPNRSEERALLAGTVCGSDEAARILGISDVMAACGTSHLVAVSGGHLVYICALVQLVLKQLRLKPWMRMVTLLASTGAFVCFCGAPASALRSWAMGLVASGAEFVGRRSHALSGACVVGLAMALLCPGCVGDLGFLLSITCVCGICLFAPYVTYALRTLVGPQSFFERPPVWLGSLGKKIWRLVFGGMTEAFGLTLISQFITLPLTLPVFGTVSLVAPLANVLLAFPFSGLLVCGLVAATGTWVPWLQTPALGLCDAFGALITSIAHTLARVPLASVPLTCEALPLWCGVGVVLLIWLVWWPRCTRLRALCAVVGPSALLVIWLVGSALFAPPEFAVLDVGQGDALLIRDGLTTMLVDTGPDDAVVEALAKKGVWHIDAVMLTHAHDDHIGGLDSLSRRMPVKQVFVAQGVDHACAAGLPVTEVSAGDVIAVGRFSLRVLWPVEPVDGTKNEHSIIGHLIFNDDDRHFDALLTGDSEAETLHEALSQYPLDGIDVVKVGHHGSAKSVDDKLLHQLQPRIALISAGEHNRFGHPDQHCLDAFAALSTKVFCTADCGTLTCYLEQHGVQLFLERPPPKAA